MHRGPLYSRFHPDLFRFGGVRTEKSLYSLWQKCDLFFPPPSVLLSWTRTWTRSFILICFLWFYYFFILLLGVSWLLISCSVHVSIFVVSYDCSLAHGKRSFLFTLLSSEYCDHNITALLHGWNIAN